MDKYNLKRFLDAQEYDYETALSEIREGRKRSHWIWYIFPQIAGLGFSSMSAYYAISSKAEAVAYMQDETLRSRLLEITEALLLLPENEPRMVMGYPDDLKLRSSMTLFAKTSPEEKVFQKVLDKYYDGMPDEKTIQLLKESGMKDE